jgi:hypothetical protein
MPNNGRMKDGRCPDPQCGSVRVGVSGLLQYHSTDNWTDWQDTGRRKNLSGIP